MKLLALLLVLGIILAGCMQSSAPPAKNPDGTYPADGSDSYDDLLLKNEPQFVKDLVTKLKTEPVSNPPTFIQKCKLDSKITYYQSPKAGDQMSVLFDANGNVLCSPDGGITGKGDNKCPEYFQTRTECDYVWTDSRAYQ